MPVQRYGHSAIASVVFPHAVWYRTVGSLSLITGGHVGCNGSTDVHVLDGLGCIVGALQCSQLIVQKGDVSQSEIGPLISVSKHPDKKIET